MAKPSEIGALLLQHVLLYPNAKLNEAAAAAYIAGLAEYDLQTIRVALAQHHAESEWFPALSQIRAQIAKLHRIADDRPDAAAAWRELAQVLHIGPSGPTWAKPKESLHPMIVQAAQAFGLDRFVQRLTENSGTDYAQFRTIYEALGQRREQAAQMLPATRDYVAQLADKLRADRPALPAPPAAAEQGAPPAAASAGRAAGALTEIRQLMNQPRAARSRDELDREAERQRLRAALALVEQELAGEGDPARRQALQLRAAGLRKSVGA